MTPKYAWFYFLDSITAPTLWAGFGLGITFATAVFSLFYRATMRKVQRKADEAKRAEYAKAAHRAARWAPCPWRGGVRPQTDMDDHRPHAVLDFGAELEMPSHEDVWVHIQHHDDTTMFHLSVVDEAHQVTNTYVMTAPQAVQLAAWLAKITMPAESTHTTHTEDTQ